MNPASGDPARIDELLTHLGELDSLLEHEYCAIRERDLIELESLTKAKQNLVDNINAMTARMGEALRELMNDGSSTHGNQIRTLITRCGQANKTNGCAIESSQSFTTSLLDILRGRLPGERIYTARGRLGASRGSSAFVRV